MVVGVADWIADPDGLFAVDFDLLTRIPGLEELDIVATSGLLASGFEQRLHDWLPGLDTVDADSLGLRASLIPTIAAPVREDGVPVWVHRDREEELVAVARRAADDQDPADCTAVVFARPLPYLYLAHEVFRSAGIAHQAVDRLPLAAEPAAAALDLIIEFVSSGFTRTSALALLRSPQLSIGAGLSRQALTGLDRALHEKQYLGDIERLRRFASDFDGDAEVREALAAVVRAADALLPLTEAAPASTQLTALSSFLAAHASPGAGARSGRACSAIVGVLRSLAAAHGSHGDRVATIDDLAPDIRRWIEEQTFEPHTSTAGVHLLDSQAARFGDFDTVTIVGLIEGEWPERARRNIFYSPGVLSALGWPSERDWRSASTAGFVDLLRSPSRRLVMSTFRFDDEALVEPSMLLEELGSARLDAVTEPAAAGAPVRLDTLDADARDWAAFRAARSSGVLPAYHGAAGPQPARPLSVSAIETYLTCPFKYFAQYVMRLDEEREDEHVMDPNGRGASSTRSSKRSSRRGSAKAIRGITPANLAAARTSSRTSSKGN